MNKTKIQNKKQSEETKSIEHNYPESELKLKNCLTNKFLDGPPKSISSYFDQDNEEYWE